MSVTNNLPGKLEEFSSARHQLGFFCNVGISASYAYEGRDLINFKEAIFSALSVVIQRHPILSAIPVDEDSASPYFARLPEINLEDAVMFLTRQTLYDGYSQDVELDSVLEKQHNTDFKTNYGTVPFWRLIILKSPNSEIEFVASFIYHHALGDGASGVAFQKHFISAMTSASAPLRSNIISPPTSPLLPNLELLHPLPIPPPSPSSTPPTPWTGGHIRLPMKSFFQTLVLPQDITTRFLHTCRAHKTTLTSTLPVLTARVLAHLLPLESPDLKCIIPVNIRRFLPPNSVADDDMGVWIDAISITYHSAEEDAQDSESTWDEARRSRAVISAYIASDGQRINVAQMKQRGDMRKVFLSTVGHERDSSFEVSNLGAVSAGERAREEGGWRMGRCGFSRSAFAAGGVFSIGAITGCDGCLCLGFSWQEGVVGERLMKDVIEGVRKEIEHVVGQ